ncbi:MAG: cation:proton antiporter subunit C [bacterium]|nr:cation:proton antiporter subunit C [Candidatus Margulisiibacteriota bacterium]
MNLINGINISVIIILIGLYGVLTKRNLIKMVMSLYVMNSGVILFFVSIAFIQGAQAAIFEDGNRLMVDPLPQAVMLTGIVIGLVITSLALALTLRIFEKYKTLNAMELLEKHYD